MNQSHFWTLLKHYESQANNTMAMLADKPESIVGKPWDAAHYIRCFRVEDEGIFLDVDTPDWRTCGRLKGLTDANAHPHHWGTALILRGPIQWVGTRTPKAKGLIQMVAQIAPFLNKPQTLDYKEDFAQMTLVLPCSWSP